MKLVSKWECGKCYEVHDNYDDAVECCQPRVREVYLCPVCAEVHRDEVWAIECCNSNELPEDYVIPPTRQELDDAGQMRLL